MKPSVIGNLAIDWDEFGSCCASAVPAAAVHCADVALRGWRVGAQAALAYAPSISRITAQAIRR
jgi:hypothetical protein